MKEQYETTGADRSALFAEVSNELFGVETPVEEADVEELSADAVEGVEDEESPELESDDVEEEDDDESILEDDDEDDEDGEAEDTEEDDSAITRTVKIDGEDKDVTLSELVDFYQRNEGKTQAAERKAQEAAAKLKQAEEVGATMEYLQYQGEFAPKYFDIQRKASNLEAAKDAFAEGRAFGGISGRDLSDEIVAAERILQKEKTALDKSYKEKMSSVDQPGRKALEERLPDIKDKFGDYANNWSEIGSEFGFTTTELNANRDFRYYHILQEIHELREFKADTEERRKDVRAKRQGKKVASKGSPKKATPSSSKKSKTGSAESDFNTLNDRIRNGDHTAKGELMMDIFKI